MSSRLLALVPLAVAINAAIAFIVNQLGLPVYLDSIGTVLAVLLAGTGAGIVVGLLSQVLAAFEVGTFMLAFAPIQVVIALLAALAASAGAFRSPARATGWGAAVGVVAGAASSVIAYLLFKGVTTTGVTGLATLLRGAGLSLPRAVVVASLLTDVVDKALVFALAAVAMRALPTRVTSRLGATTH
jgi:energy-coupling factor transport system substrate-specific component